MTVVVVIEGDGGEHEQQPGLAAGLGDALDGLQQVSPNNVGQSVLDSGPVDESDQHTPVARVGS